jgi:ADP-ribose pyrophosphatase YjhB (NUDIX family)
MQATLVVSAAVVLDGRLLMVQEGKEYCRGLWGLPGGRVEPGERIGEAIVREVREETGLDVRVVGLTRVVRYFSQLGYHTMRFNFVVEPTGGELRIDGEEILAARWMSFEEIEALADEEIRTAVIARQVLDDIRERRVFPVEIVLDAV